MSRVSEARRRVAAALDLLVLCVQALQLASPAPARPDPDLAGLLGLTDSKTDLADANVQIDTGAGKPGASLVGQTMQFHGTADRYDLTAGAETLATLHSNAGGS
jgi:hypothetical protein